MDSNLIFLKPEQNLESEVCNNVPLHHINLVQPHGLLLVIDCQDDSYKIVQASENSFQIIGIEVKDLINISLARLFGENQVSQLFNKLKRWQISNHFPFEISWPKTEKKFSGLVHQVNNYFILEIEPQDADRTLLPDLLYKEISHLIAIAKASASIEKLTQLAATELKRISGFDRVMMYKFDRSWNGQVIAEACEPQMEEYLGLNFPSSDIPKQARELYYKTPYRLIADVNAKPVRLYPIVNPVTNSLTDISLCLLRAVPNVHTEYLNNMQVQASMSTPIIIDNKLWGLISCHNRQPVAPGFKVRSLFEVFSSILAGQLNSLTIEKKFQHTSLKSGITINITKNFFQNTSLKESIAENSAYIMDLLEVEGLAFCLNKTWHHRGNTPDNRQLQNLVKWLSRNSPNKVSAYDSLPTTYDDAKNFKDIGSGLLAIQLGNNDYLLGFRPEVTYKINWGGNPENRIQYDATGSNYHPRNSFKKWQQLVELSSKSWKEETLEAASQLRMLILEKMVLLEEIL